MIFDQTNRMNWIWIKPSGTWWVRTAASSILLYSGENGTTETQGGWKFDRQYGWPTYARGAPITKLIQLLVTGPI